MILLCTVHMPVRRCLALRLDLPPSEAAEMPETIDFEDQWSDLEEKPQARAVIRFELGHEHCLTVPAD